jgi:transposase
MAKKGQRSTNAERIRAVQLIESGEATYAEVAAELRVGESTLYEWMRKYRAGGLAALSTKMASGRPTALSDRQMLELMALIVGCEPRQLSFGFALWTRKLVRDLIRQRFGVGLSVQHVGRILKKLGLSPQRPMYRAYQQDPQRVQRWKDQEYPAIRARAAEEGAQVFFADEAAVRTDHHAGTTWAPIGRTPVVTSTGDRASIMMASAISTTGALRFHVHEGSFKARHFIAFCRQLLSDVDGKVFLIVDGSSVHTAKEVKEFVKSTGGRLSLFFLPPYSPELNPDEWVWKNVKHDHIGRVSVRGLDELKAVADRALRRLQKTPRIILGFFADPALAYIFR